MAIGSLEANTTATNSDHALFIDNQTESMNFKPYSNALGTLQNTFTLKMESSFEAFGSDLHAEIDLSQTCQNQVGSYKEFYYSVPD